MLSVSATESESTTQGTTAEYTTSAHIEMSDEDVNNIGSFHDAALTFAQWFHDSPLNFSDSEKNFFSGYKFIFDDFLLSPQMPLQIHFLIFFSLGVSVFACIIRGFRGG